jgi:segregation and condensation protein A
MARQTETLDFEPIERAEGEPLLVVDVAGYEGPLDLLLDLARRQKVDLAGISILALAEQYLAFIAEARRLRLELAADYLVMAAWLAYLKSRLLLPDKDAGEGPKAEELAADLAERLARLEQIRRAAARLGAREQLGVEVFGRGAPEPVIVHNEPMWQVSLHDLVTAYLDRRRHVAASRVTIQTRSVWSLQEAREILERLVGKAIDWTAMDAAIDTLGLSGDDRRTARASSFAAALELVREGNLDMRQEKVFAPIFLRRRAPVLAVVKGEVRA